MADLTVTTPASDLPTITFLPVGAPFALVGHGLYRNIHKALRADLFAVCVGAGTLDPSDQAGRSALATQVLSTVELLEQHGSHEDVHIQPVLESTLPHLAERVASDHVTVDAAMATLASIPPDEMTAALARTLPAMNLDDRVEMLGAMQRDAPPEVFEGTWNLARIVLSPAELTPLAHRLALT